MTNIKSFVFLDIEATGLPCEYLHNRLFMICKSNYDFSGYEFNKTRITEISLVACSSSHLQSSINGLPRVLHKLTLCMYPSKRISSEAEEMTGLTNELLEQENKFTNNTAETIFSFLKNLQQPCCLVAHNGLRFDFPILKKELVNVGQQIPDAIFVVDSLEVFRDLELIENSNSLGTSFVPIMIESNSQYNEPTELRSSNNVTDIRENMINNEMVDEELDLFIKSELQSLDENKLIEYNTRELHETTPKKHFGNSIDGVSSSFASRAQNFGVKNENKLFKKFSNENHGTRSRIRRDLFGAKQSFKLCDIYERFFNKLPRQSHYAEEDVLSLLKCAALKGKSFIENAEKHAILFKNIKALGSMN